MSSVNDIRTKNVYITFDEKRNIYFLKHQGEPSFKLFRMISDFIGKLFGNLYGKEGLEELSKRQGNFKVATKCRSFERQGLVAIGNRYGLFQS